MRTAVVHGRERDIWEVRQTQDLLVESDTACPPPPKSSTGFSLWRSWEALSGRHPHCRQQQFGISAGLSLKHGLGIIKHINTQTKVQCCTTLSQLSQKLSVATTVATEYFAPSTIFTPLCLCLHGTGTWNLHLLGYTACRGTVRQTRHRVLMHDCQCPERSCRVGGFAKVKVKFHPCFVFASTHHCN